MSNSAAAHPQSETRRRVVFVAGSGRSGTSTMAGALRTLGLHVPQPEVSADATNPKGFGEPQWVVDLHTELLARSNVAVSDARPDAWLATGRLSADHALRLRVSEFLAEQFGHGEELVIKDPRAGWFLGLWRAAADWQDASSAYVTMLRPPAEVVGSKEKYYSGQGNSGEITRTAGWLNMMLHTERATRGEQRAFVRYADLLADWTIPVFAIGEAFDLVRVKTAMAGDIRAVHDFIDPSLRRVTIGWEDISVPTRLRDLAEETWQVLNGLADPGGDTSEAHARLDDLRVAYGDYYAEVDALAHFSILAARREGARQARAELAERVELRSGLREQVKAVLPERVVGGVRRVLRGAAPHGDGGR